MLRWTRIALGAGALGVTGVVLSTALGVGPFDLAAGSQPVAATSTVASSASPVPSSTTAPADQTTTTPPTSTTTEPPATTSAAPSAPATPPTTTARPAPQQAVGAPCSATARACVDLSANKAWLIANGRVVYGPVPITHGRPGWRTPPGTFRVQWKNRHHRSRTFNNAPMPYSVFFNGGIAFHEGSLQEQSHGCIHLSRAAAAKFFADLKVGDIVQVVP
ncbi:MAG TPA: L,D-transpeptidase [Pseudonocardiaceae bacterium]